MKVEELMIGDYVGVCVSGADTICKIEQIQPEGVILKIVEAFPINKNDDKSIYVGRSTYRRVEDIQPLPLTEWVLRYNHFMSLYEKETKEDFVSMWVLKEDMHDMVAIEFFYYRTDDNEMGRLVTSLVLNPHRTAGGEYVAMNYITRLKYVHEFQRILKVLGVDKEILITKNEKKDESK